MDSANLGKDSPDWEVEDAQREIDASRSLGGAGLGVLVLAVGIFVALASPPGRSGFNKALLGGAALTIGGLGHWAYLRFFKRRRASTVDLLSPVFSGTRKKRNSST